MTWRTGFRVAAILGVVLLILSLLMLFFAQTLTDKP
jgi:ABC-type sulfate transport system permease component